MKKLFFKFLDSMKDKHGEFNMSLIYLMISITISLILGIGLLYQLQERSFLEDELDRTNLKYEQLKEQSEESIKNYNTLKTEKENLEKDYNKLENDIKEKDSFLENCYANISNLENNLINYKTQLENSEIKLKTLLNLLVSNHDILQKYYDAIEYLEVDNNVIPEDNTTVENNSKEQTGVNNQEQNIAKIENQ